RLKHRGQVTGLTTGFIDLDRQTLGLQKSDLIIIAGRPGMGKSALGWQIAVQAAKATGRVVLFVSCEMSPDQLGDRTLALASKVGLGRIRSGFVSENQAQQVRQAKAELTKVPLILDDAPGATIQRVRFAARKVKREQGLGLLVIDYLQLMQGRQGLERREQEVAEISRRLKALAKELNVPVVALSQLNRKSEERPDKRPRLADLRESGAIEQDADVILFIYRDEVYNPKSTDGGTAEIIIAKQRQGPTGLVRLAFNSALTRFDNLDVNYNQRSLNG
ncbi:MAG: replicative DNA helicase, partial [Deltaproteobacteria bacterium]|nr:replicative DNA helicase [Deltaproteobacteria bacterium]